MLMLWTWGTRSSSCGPTGTWSGPTAWTRRGEAPAPCGGVGDGAAPRHGLGGDPRAAPREVVRPWVAHETAGRGASGARRERGVRGRGPTRPRRAASIPTPTSRCR